MIEFLKHSQFLNHESTTNIGYEIGWKRIQVIKKKKEKMNRESGKNS